MTHKSLPGLLQKLARVGCYPSIYRRGKVWRAHVNAAGNCWDEAESPYAAMVGAIRVWRQAGSPIPADRVDELRHRIEGSIKLVAAVAELDVRELLHDVQLLAVIALDAEESCTATTSDQFQELS